MLKMAQTPAYFVCFLVLLNTNLTEKTVGFPEIRTQIVGVEGEHADHLTTTRIWPVLQRNKIVKYEPLDLHLPSSVQNDRLEVRFYSIL